MMLLISKSVDFVWVESWRKYSFNSIREAKSVVLVRISIAKFDELCLFAKAHALKVINRQYLPAGGKLLERRISFRGR